VLKQCVVLIGAILLVAAETPAATAAISQSEPSPSAKGFRYYPGYSQPGGMIEVVHDKGLMLELIVRCPVGVGIITFSRVEGMYCLPNHRCTGDLDTALYRLCE
jgi:hypothetical protein